MVTREQLNELIFRFPNLATGRFQVTSPEDGCYNCVAWAVNDATQIWWPRKEHGIYWPRDCFRASKLSSLISAFRREGYREGNVDDVNGDREWIAIYLLDGVPQHVARSLRDGGWTSKIGSSFDIVHELIGLSGSTYGEPTVAMFRDWSV